MQRGSSGGGVFEPVQEHLEARYQDPALLRGEKEITLGTAGLALLGAGLFGLCALCFGLGYAAGHRSPLEVPNTSAAAVTESRVGLANAQPKPSATQQVATPAGAATETGDRAAAEPSGTSGAPADAADNGTDSAPPADSVLRTALVTQPAGRADTPATRDSGIMVQIAAVAHTEDADVLVGALRKRGYAVSAHRDPTDGLLHVQVGPFPGRAEAVAMRQKLLNDGYNAVVE